MWGQTFATQLSLLFATAAIATLCSGCQQAADIQLDDTGAFTTAGLADEPADGPGGDDGNADVGVPPNAPEPPSTPTVTPSPTPSVTPSPAPSMTPSPTPSNGPVSACVPVDGMAVCPNVAVMSVQHRSASGQMEDLFFNNGIGLVNVLPARTDVFTIVGSKLKLPAGSEVREINLHTYNSNDKLQGRNDVLGVVIKDGKKYCDLRVPSGVVRFKAENAVVISDAPDAKYRLYLQLPRDVASTEAFFEEIVRTRGNSGKECLMDHRFQLTIERIQ